MSSETHYRVCNLCEAMCGIKVNVDSAEMPGDVNIVIKPDTNDPFSKGSMCPKAPALASLHTDPSRLRQPVKRVDDEWIEISWNEAYATIEENIKRIRREHGEDSIASYLGNPIVHNMGMMLFVKSLTEAIGSKNVFSATSMDQLPHHFAAHFMFGHEFRIPVPDVDRTDFMIIMGANPIASNGSIMTSAGIRERLGAIKQRGGQFVVLDPRQTETAKLATTHHFIQPGTDVFFLLAFLHVLYRDDLIRTDMLNEHLLDLEKIKAVAQCITPSQAELITGVDASEIERLAHDYSQQARAVLYGRMGLSTQRHGGLCHWLINCINIVSGHFDTPGGMMFPKPAIELARGGSQPKRFARWSSRVRKMPEFYGELPVSAMTEEMTTPGAGQVKAFMSVCGNPVLSTPGGHRLDAALPDVEFMFSIDNYINETTRHANIILPTPSGLEVEHFDLIFNLISVTNNVKYSKSVFPPSADTPLDWEVLKELIARLSPSGAGFLHRYKTPRRIINWGLMLGAYGKLSHPKRWFSGLTLKKVMDSTHGISLGPLQPRVPEGMLTPDKKIHLAPKVFTDRLDELMSEHKLNETNERSTDKPARPFSLIGRRHVSTNNSWMHQFKKLSASRQVRCTAMINSEDATRLSVVDEEIIKVASDVGEITLPAEVTDTVMPGVISIPHGFGHTRSGTRIPNAEAKPGVSVNDITDHNHVDELTGNAAFSGLNVSIEKTETKQTTDATSGIPLTILYGSRTGNAEFTARDIAKRAKQQGLLPLVKAMDDVDLAQFSDWERILIVCSTYGEGDMPDNAQQLWNQINTPTAPSINNVFFSVLGFGDRSYDTFCEAGKQWDKRLVELGATRVADRTDCDVDYIDATETWVKTVLPIMLTVGDLTVVEANEQYLQSSDSVRYGPNNPLSAKILEKYKLNGDGSSKETYHYVLSLSGEDVSYTVGDTLNVLPSNQPSLVNELLALVNSDGSEIIGDNKQTVYERLLTDFEIRIPSHSLLNAIAERSAEPSIRTHMSSLLAGDRSAREKYLRGKDVIDLLQTSPELITSSEALLNVLPPLAPRSYSISSSVNRHPDEVHLTIANVRYSSEGRDYCGVASCFLADHQQVGDRVDVYFVPNNAFSLPENDAVPIIMIGPGTGVAPFRGFLQEREFRKASGKSWLFFGDRNAENDFLYRQEMNAWLEDGVLDRLDLAFSRDQDEKVYVQNRMLDNAAQMFRWLEDGAVVYVCGDAENMAKDVDTALHTIVQEQGQYSESEASTYITKLAENKRYLLDVY